jgi:formylglycine-generating enzyme required for sulfatase activity
MRDLPDLFWPKSLSVQAERSLQARDIFRECSNCPEMVVLPAGSFMMGSPANEKGRDANEGPQHQVSIASNFAVSRFEATFDDWGKCVAMGGCRDYQPGDQGWGRGTRPILNVSWDDAVLYAAWLSKKTGRSYRLLSEAEFEYAARAGSTTAYPWGNDIGDGNANCHGCGGIWDGKLPAPVGSFAANAFGLFDIIGNGWEWVQDCWHVNYQGAPDDGSAWVKSCQGGDFHVVRGGSRFFAPQDMRSAHRTTIATNIASYDLGFRVARTLVASGR